MAAASTARLSVNSASAFTTEHSANDSFLQRLAKTFVLMSAGMQYQAGSFSEEMAYLSRDVFRD